MSKARSLFWRALGVFMNHVKVSAVLAVLMIFASVSYGQSLGDVARQQRQKQQQTKATAPHKVITNEDLPAHSADDADSASVTTTEDSKRAAASSSSAGKKTAEEWKSQIQAQKAKVAAMQSDVDKLNASVHYVEANRYTNGVQYNQAQSRKQQESERLQKRLDEQKKALSDMQEACRRAGFGSAVYEP